MLHGVQVTDTSQQTFQRTLREAGLHGRIAAKWLESWTSNRKVARSNPRANKEKICRSAPEQGSY